MATQPRIATYPAFFRPVSSVRSTGVKEKQNSSYQRLATIYLLRLALGIKDELPRRSIKEFFEGDLGKLTGLADIEDELALDQIEDEFPFNDEAPTPKAKASKAELIKHMRQHLKNLLNQGFSSTDPLFKNMDLLAKKLKLTQAEQEILILRLLMPLIEAYRVAVIEHCNLCTPQSTVGYLVFEWKLINLIFINRL